MATFELRGGLSTEALKALSDSYDRAHRLGKPYNITAEIVDADDTHVLEHVHGTVGGKKIEETVNLAPLTRGRFSS